MPSAPAAPAVPAPAAAPTAIDLAPAAVDAPAVPATPAAPAAPTNPMGLAAFAASDPNQPAAPAAPAPVQTPVQTDKPAEKPADKPVGSVGELAGHLATDSTVAPAVAYMEAVLADAEVDITRALGAAADYLDPSRIDVHYLREKLGDKADQVIKLATSTLEYAASYSKESVSQVYAVAGGEAQWGLAVNAFNTQADPTERAMLAELLNSGVRDKMLYAAKKITEYGVSAGAVTRHNAPPLGSPSSEKGLSRAEFAEAISKRGIQEGSTEYQNLRRLRQLGMSQGL